MPSQKMSSKVSFKVLPLIFGISVMFFGYSIASARNDREKDTASLASLDGTRYASISTQPIHNGDDSRVNTNSIEAEITAGSEKSSAIDTEKRQPIGIESKYKRDADSERSQKSTAGSNFLSNLFHRFTEITRSHNRLYDIVYKSAKAGQRTVNTTANATTDTSSSSEIQTSRIRTNSNTPVNHANSTDAITPSRKRLQIVETANHPKDPVKTEHPSPSKTPSNLAKNHTLYGSRDDPQKPCRTCRTRALLEDEIVALRTAQFKDLLLDKLRLSEADLSVKPSRGYPKLPRDVLKKTLRDNAKQEALEEFYAQDKELILDGRDLGRKCITGRQVTGCYIFVLQGKVRGEVASAQLWLYKTPDGNDVSGQTVRVFQLEKTRRGRLRRRNLMIRQDTYIQEGWVTMNVTRSVRSWVDKRMQTAMMAIRCDTCRTRNHKALYGAKDGYRPLLIIDYDTSVSSARKRRTVDDCDPTYECCKKNLVINFNTIGMPTVLFPPNISIGYCSGYCNDSPQYMYNHTQLIQSARLNDPNLNATVRRQLQPCCIPLTFRDTFLIVFANQAFIQTTVPNVIVSSCGCV